MARVELLLATAVLLVVGTVLHGWSAQPAPRYLATVAIVDHGTLAIDEHADLLFEDHAWRDGHFYSDKAPYQPLLAVPFYALFRAAGGGAFPMGPDGPVVEGTFHWGLWWVGLWSVALPAAALVVVLRRLAATVRPGVSTSVALALSFGTLLLPMASVLFGHLLAATCIAGAWLLVRAPRPPPLAMFGAGLLASAAVGTEYTLVVPGALVGVAALVAHGTRRTALMVLGVALGALPLLLHNWAAFGSPWRTAYQGNLPNFQGSGALGVYNLVPPQAAELTRALVGDRGLLTLTPICLVAVVFATLAVARPGPTRRDGALALLVLGSLWVMSAGIDGYGGSAPGPRYLVPAIPFLAVPLADAWHRMPRVCTVAALLGAVPMVLATVTAPLISSSYARSARYWFDRAAAGELADSVPGQLLGRGALWGVVVLGLGAAAGALHADRQLRRASVSGPDPRSAGSAPVR